MEHYEVTVINLHTKKETQLSVDVDEAETSESIIISAVASNMEITSSNHNYLSAYQAFRDQLLQLGYGIKCNGSKRNAVQSGMMGANDKIYLVEMGKQAQRKNIVSIWDFADIDEFPDTMQQCAFFEQWMKR